MLLHFTEDVANESAPAVDDADRVVVPQVRTAVQGSSKAREQLSRGQLGGGKRSKNLVHVLLHSKVFRYLLRNCRRATWFLSHLRELHMDAC